jgi:hypothetical protein
MFILSSKIRLFVLLVAPILLGLISCNKEEEKLQPVNNQLTLEVSNYWQGKKITELNQEILFGEGQKVKPTALGVILSNFEISGGGQKLQPEEKAFVFSLDKPTRKLNFRTASLPSSNEFSFTVGLDSAQNYQNPLQLPENHELFRPDMHWSWNPSAGYKFLKLEALLNDSIRVIYHYAHTQNKVRVTLSSPRSFNTANPLKLRIDWGRFVDNINLALNRSWMTNDDIILNQLKFNLMQNEVFSLE